MQSYTIANIGSMLAVLVGLVNIFTFREMWILFAAMSVLIILAVYAVKERAKLKYRQAS
jgi:competence protein ComGC